MARCRVLLLVGFALGLSVSIAVAGERWKTFRGPHVGYTVKYPASWRLGGVGEDFGISNFAADQAVHGVGLPVGGATISILGPPTGVHDIAAWIGHDERGDIVVDTRDVPIGSPQASGCTQITEVVTRVDVTVPAWIFTSLYCETSRGLYRITLQNYKDDPKQAQYQDLTVGIAKSLRAAESAR